MRIMSWAIQFLLCALSIRTIRAICNRKLSFQMQLKFVEFHSITRIHFKFKLNCCSNFEDGFFMYISAHSFSLVFWEDFQKKLAIIKPFFVVQRIQFERYSYFNS